MKKVPIKAMALAMVMVHSQISFSQSQENDSIKDKHINLKEIVISVNKTEEQKSKVAQQTQTIGAVEIKNLQAQTTAELISRSGIQVQMSQQGGGSPTLRGFEANRIVLMIDGVRLNNLIYRGGHLQDIIKTDIHILDRVEVLFGPSSTVYGSDALGGVIHLYSKKPKFSEIENKRIIETNAFSRYGTVNREITGHIDINIGNQKIASLTSFSYSQFGDLMGGKNQNPFYNGSYGERSFYAERIDGKDSLVKNSNRYLQVGSAYSQYNFLEKVLYKQSEKIMHGLNVQYSTSTDVPRYDRLTDPKGAGLNSAEWYYGPQKRLLAAYDLNLNNLKNYFSEIHFGINYQQLEESRHSRTFGNDFRKNRIEDVDVLGANIDLQKRTKNQRIRLGADMQLNALKSTANQQNIVTGELSKLDTRFPDGKNTLNNFAFYVSHTWEINKNFILVDGLRVGYSSLYSSLIDTALLFHLPYTEINQKNPLLSGNIGIIHSASDDVKISFLVSSGYRVPNTDDVTKIFGSTPGKVIVPNINLKTEKTINYEIGLTKIFNQKTRWENTIYYTQYFDIAVVDTFRFNNKDSILYDGSLSRVYANQNKKSAYLYGFSSNLITCIDNNFSMSAGINYTYGRIKTDSTDVPLDHIPPLLARIEFTYHLGKLSTSLFALGNGAKKLKDYYLNGEDNEQYATEMGMPAWICLNFHATYEASSKIRIQGGINNLFDTQYRTFASGINAPGRNIFVSISAKF